VKWFFVILPDRRAHLVNGILTGRQSERDEQRCIVVYVGARTPRLDHIEQADRHQPQEEQDGK
jgi:hypothetical protein